MRSLFLLTLLTALVPAAAGQASEHKVHPDLEGFWSNATLTPFERPAEFAGKEFFTDAEASAFEKRIRERNDRDRRAANPQADVNQAYNEIWFDRGTSLFPSRRTSIVVDPTNGRVPPLTPAAQRAAAERDEVQARPPEGPEDLGTTTRCIVWPTAGPPMVPGPYNNNYQIMQTADSVAIRVEMIHDVRVIPTNGRPHLSRNMRLWMGDPRGKWEGDTLVVDTTNFTDKIHFRGSDENLHLIERFTRTGPNTIVYRFTVDDPSAFTAPWTGEIIMTKTNGPIYEYACHEGNYSMTNILRGARYADNAGKNR